VRRWHNYGNQEAIRVQRPHDIAARVRHLPGRSATVHISACQQYKARKQPNYDSPHLSSLVRHPLLCSRRLVRFHKDCAPTLVSLSVQVDFDLLQVQGILIPFPSSVSSLFLSSYTNRNQSCSVVNPVLLLLLSLFRLSSRKPYLWMVTVRCVNSPFR
jgi:hypothetical protein